MQGCRRSLQCSVKQRTVAAPLKQVFQYRRSGCRSFRENRGRRPMWRKASAAFEEFGAGRRGRPGGRAAHELEQRRATAFAPGGRVPCRVDLIRSIVAFAGRRAGRPCGAGLWRTPLRWIASVSRPAFETAGLRVRRSSRRRVPRSARRPRWRTRASATPRAADAQHQRHDDPVPIAAAEVLGSVSRSEEEVVPSCRSALRQKVWVGGDRRAALPSRREAPARGFRCVVVIRRSLYGVQSWRSSLAQWSFRRRG